MIYMKKLKTLLLFFVFTATNCFSQTGLPFDVLHYRFEILLDDSNDSIKMKAFIKFTAISETNAAIFDLSNIDAGGKGMQVQNALSSVPGLDITMKHENNKLRVGFSRSLKKGDTASITINYTGIPGDGLIISKNKFGRRTFFSDNWPNRAHHWLACVDHPADKAGVEFIVTAPNHYQVVSNGIQMEETDLPGNKKLTHWKEEIPLPPKIMVIGVAEFAVQYAGDAAGIPVYSWVYPQNRNEGFYDYEQAREILPFFINFIGPYAYKKLANIQSLTLFGGMENASAIFYSENSVTGKRTIEGLLAHEIAHQWFGNMATEKNFSHIWLSEGFATYFTNLYMEYTYGRMKMIEMLEEQRKEVIRYSKRSVSAVIDTNSNYMELLNANSYQKGGWILHMLRNETGDELFQKIIRSYYRQYAGKNADSEDLRKLTEEISKKNMEQFFTQWLYRPGQPDLNITWQFDSKNNKLNLDVVQKQKDIFHFPLEIFIRYPSGAKTEKIFINSRTKTFSFPVKMKPLSVSADPDVKLLFEASVTQKPG